MQKMIILGWLIVFGAAIFALGLICTVLHLAQGAYLFEGITLTIIMLVTRGQAPWIIAVHRFIEVSLGIAVSRALTYGWPGPELISSRGSEGSLRR